MTARRVHSERVALEFCQMVSRQVNEICFMEAAKREWLDVDDLIVGQIERFERIETRKGVLADLRELVVAKSELLEPLEVGQIVERKRLQLVARQAQRLQSLRGATERAAANAHNLVEVKIKISDDVFAERRVLQLCQVCLEDPHASDGLALGGRAEHMPKLRVVELHTLQALVVASARLDGVRIRTHTPDTHRRDEYE